MQPPQADFIVIGSGIGGLRAALEIASEGARVVVLTKDRAKESNTEYAQGGVAVALAADDDPELHEHDTISAGAGLSDPEAVHVLVSDGRRYVRELIEWGARFDREEGRLLFTREAAHSRRRILHARGDATGHEIVRALIQKAASDENITFLPHAATEVLLLEDRRCCGVRYLDPLVRAQRELRALSVLLATGGAGQLFWHTTNPLVATGDGLAMAYGAGAELADLEFVQFHPTALSLEGAPRFLLSEAMRGEGGVLRNESGNRFMPRYHESAELAPRDVVSRAIVAEMKRTGQNVVYLDMTELNGAFLRHRFPGIYRTCLRYGLDMAHDLLPVSPAAHYMMGGIRTDLHGRSTVPGLYACGEVACTGVHGANRLASNSLLEGLVFGARAGRAAINDAQNKHEVLGCSAGGAEQTSCAPLEPARKVSNKAAQPIEEITAPVQLEPAQESMSRTGDVAFAVSKRVRRLMWDRVGIIRTRQSLERAIKEFTQIAQAPLRTPSRNFLTVATLVTRSALWREESRGSHFRGDFPRQDDSDWQVHSITRIGVQISASTVINFEPSVNSSNAEWAFKES